MSDKEEIKRALEAAKYRVLWLENTLSAVIDAAIGDHA